MGSALGHNKVRHEKCSSHSRNAKEAQLHRKLSEKLASVSGAEFSQHPALLPQRGVAQKHFQWQELNSISRAGLHWFQCTVAKMSVCNTGTKKLTTHKEI